MIVSCAIRLELASLRNAVCFAAVTSTTSDTFVIGEVGRCVMQIVVAPCFFARPSASVTSRLAPVCEIPSATSSDSSSEDDIAIRSPSESAIVAEPELEELVVGVERERRAAADAVDLDAARPGDRLDRAAELHVVEHLDRVAQRLGVRLEHFRLHRRKVVVGLDRGVDLGRRLDHVAREHDLELLVALVADFWHSRTTVDSLVFVRSASSVTVR